MLCTARVPIKIQTWNSICQEPRNELQLFWLSDRYSAIWIDPSGPTIAESIGCCFWAGMVKPVKLNKPTIPRKHRTQTQIGWSTEIKTRGCNLQCGPAQRCGPVGGHRLKSNLFNRYVIVYDCGHDHADHVIVGTWSFRNIPPIIDRHRAQSVALVKFQKNLIFYPEKIPWLRLQRVISHLFPAKRYKWSNRQDLVFVRPPVACKDFRTSINTVWYCRVLLLFFFCTSRRWN